MQIYNASHPRAMVLWHRRRSLWPIRGSQRYCTECNLRRRSPGFALFQVDFPQSTSFRTSREKVASWLMARNFRACSCRQAL